MIVISLQEQANNFANTFFQKNVLGGSCIKVNAVREYLIFSKISILWLVSGGFSYVTGDFRRFRLVSEWFQVVTRFSKYGKF